MQKGKPETEAWPLVRFNPSLFIVEHLIFSKTQFLLNELAFPYFI